MVLSKSNFSTTSRMLSEKPLMYARRLAARFFGSLEQPLEVVWRRVVEGEAGCLAELRGEVVELVLEAGVAV